MVKVGDKLFHWSFGELVLTEIKQTDTKTYLHTRVCDTQGVIDLFNTFMNDERVFNANVLGFWLHDNMTDAIINNRNNNSAYPKCLEPNGVDQGQSPLGMKFPINGDGLHQSYEFVHKLEETNKGYKNKINDIKKHIIEIDNKYDRPLKDIKLLVFENSIKSYIDKYNEDTNDEDLRATVFIQEYLKKDYNKVDFEWDKGIEETLEIFKTSFTDDNAFNEFRKKIVYLFKDIENLTLKNKMLIIEKLKSMDFKLDSINKLIEKYQDNMDRIPHNISEIVIDKLVEERNNELEAYNNQIELMNSKIKKNNQIKEKLDDERYITFEK